MHTKPMKESDGTLDEAHPTDWACRKCGEFKVSVQIWKSSDGAYEDEKYTCAGCAHVWWIDGIDS